MHLNFYRFCSFVFILTFWLSQISAQQPEPVFRHFTTEDGLPSSQVYQAFQDTDGYMWFATDRGVVKFNGYEFKTFTTKDGLTDNVIFYLFQDFKKRIWMISFSGNIFIYENNTISSYKYNSTIRLFIKGSFQLEISVDSLENVYVASFFGEFLIDPNGVVRKTYDYDNRKGIIKLLIDDSQNHRSPVALGFVTEPWKFHVLYHLHPLGVDSIPLPEVVTGRMRTVLRKNKALLFSLGKNLYELKNKKVIHLAKSDSEIINLYEDSNESLWLCTMKGLVMYSETNCYTDHYTYLTGKYISDITEDREKGFWVTTIDDGVYYLINKNVKNYFSDTKLNSPIAFTCDKYQIYAGYFSGSLARMNTKEFTLIYTDFSGREVNSIYFDTSSSKLYIGNKDLHYIQNGRSHFLNDTVNNNSTVGFVKKKDGLYSAAFGKLIRVSGDSAYNLGNFKTRINCLGTNEKDDLVLGCIDGVYHYDEFKKNIYFLDPRLEGIRVDDVKLFNGNLCFASHGKGLMILKRDGSLVTIDESNGLCSNVLHTLCVSGNTIWCGSNNGISKINFFGADDSEYSITAINVTNGLISNEINDIEHLNDTIWIATKKGISFFSCATDFVNDFPPSIYFISIKINNVDTIVNDNYVLPHTFNTVRIGFESPLFKSEGRQSYHYLLVNAEDSIEGITTNREMDFLSLKAGRYSLFVKATNNSGVGSIRPEVLNFVILAPWWQSSWFRILGFFTLLLAVVIMYKRRVGRIDEMYRIEKKQASLQLTAMRAQMNPHFIFNVMDSIRNYMMDHNTLAAEKYLTSFAKLVRYTLEQSDKQECSLEEELSMIRVYIELEKERFSKLIEVEILVAEDIDISEVMVPTMILQPFVENAFKHGLRNNSKGGLLTVRVIENGQGVAVYIEDNGDGREIISAVQPLKSINSQSYGILLVQERIDSYNKAYGRKVTFQTVQLKNNKDEICGTRIVLEF